MNTAEALEGITDAGKYEILSTQALRVLKPDCRSISHFGVNAAGKTIPNVVDGFCLVPGSDPPHYVMTAFATVSKEKLERKWLFDHSSTPNAKKAKDANDGDLIKAGKLAASIRLDQPLARFSVYLCTNRGLDPDIIKSVHVTAHKLGVTADFLEQSKLRDFLDTTPDGQWLRKAHLGIEADQLPFPLMRELSKRSQNNYADEILLPQSHEIIVTKRFAAVGSLFADASKPLLFLVGPSGSGKSLLAHQLLASQLDEGLIGVWIPSEVAERHTLLSAALEECLRTLYPTMPAGSGDTCLKLASPERPLVVIIDDINRSTSPARLLDKAISWSRPPNLSAGHETGGVSSVRVRKRREEKEGERRKEKEGKEKEGHAMRAPVATASPRFA
jgi:hypothetical protein